MELPAACHHLYVLRLSAFLASLSFTFFFSFLCQCMEMKTKVANPVYSFVQLSMYDRVCMCGCPFFLLSVYFFASFMGCKFSSKRIVSGLWNWKSELCRKRRKERKRKCGFCLVALKATVNVMCASLLHNLIFVCLRSCLGTGFCAIVLSLCLPFHLFQQYNAMARTFWKR